MDWQSLLPSNSSQLECDLEATIAEFLWSIPIDLNKILRPYECPIELLPWLAWALSVDQWDISWLEATKRQVVAESFAIHQKKGTRWAVERLMSITGHNNVEIVEWWQTQPKGNPHTFYMKIPSSPGFDPVILSENQYGRIRRVVDSVKPVRSQYRFSITSKFAVTKPPIIIDNGGGSGGISVDGSCPAEAGISVPILVCQRDAKTITKTDHNFFCVPSIQTENGSVIKGNSPAETMITIPSLSFYRDVKAVTKTDHEFSGDQICAFSAIPTNFLKGDFFAKPDQKISWKNPLQVHVSTQPCSIANKNVVARAKQDFTWTKGFQTGALFQPISTLSCEVVL
jgi:phage tail P2-like protein